MPLSGHRCGPECTLLLKLPKLSWTQQVLFQQNKRFPVDCLREGERSKKANGWEDLWVLCPIGRRVGDPCLCQGAQLGRVKGERRCMPHQSTAPD